MSSQYLPNVLVLTEENISTAHGTGTTLIRHFRNYPQEKLLNIYWMPKGEPVFQNSIYAQYHWIGGQPSKTSYDFSVVRFPTNVRQLIEETGFVPNIIYSTFFGWFGVKLLDLILKEYNYQLPVIQHFHDLQMPFDDLGPLEPELQAITPHLNEIWALTPSIAEDVSFITGRDVQVVNTFCDVVPSIYKQEHREFSSDFTAVITGNIWISEIIDDLKSAWQWVGKETGGVKPIQWYCHKENMRENLEKYVFSDRKPVIEYAGFVRGDDLYRVLANSDIAIIPFNRHHDPENNYAKYSLPSRLTETALTGVPAFVAAGSRTVTARYVQEKGLGITATASDPNRFRETLFMFVKNRNIREKCGKQARIVGQTEYDIDRYEKFFYGKLAEVATTTKQIPLPVTSGAAFVTSGVAAAPDGVRSATILICTPDVDSPITQRCIESIRRYTNTPYELIVLENGKFGNFKHAREINRALEIGRGDVFITLDDDVEVTAGWLESLLALAQPDVGIVGCVHYDAREGNRRKQVIDHAGGIVAIDGSSAHYKGSFTQPVTAPFACSACILINDTSLRFDLDYDKYYQDVDLCLRVWESGKKVVISPHAVYHYISGQMEVLGYNDEKKLRLFARDLEIFRDKWINNGRLHQLILAIKDRLDLAFSQESFGSVDILTVLAELPEQSSQIAANSGSNLSTYATGQFVMSKDQTRQLLSQRIRQAQDALNSWNYLRLRQDETARRSKLLSHFRPLAFLYVFLARLRKLGRVWSAEGRLYETLLRLDSDIVETLLKVNAAETGNSNLVSFASKIDLLSRRVEDLNSLMSRVENQQQQLAARIDELDTLVLSQHDRILTQIISPIQDKVEHLEGLDESMRLGISYIRMMQQKPSQHDTVSLPSNVRGNGIADLIRHLEEEMIELRHAKQVDVTIQSGGAEDEIALVAAHLGERLNVMTPQLWYYVDFHPDWYRPTLFQSAQHKVKEGGKLVVITGSEHELPIQNGDTNLIFEGARALPEVNVTVYIWRNQ